MTTWHEVLPHRDNDDLHDAVKRLEGQGLTPELVKHAVGGGFAEDLLNPARWDAYGGLWGVAVLAQEIDARAYYTRRRASAIRYAAVAQLGQEHSNAEIARRLGQSRQAISKLANGERSFQDIARRLLYELKGL